MPFKLEITTSYMADYVICTKGKFLCNINNTSSLLSYGLNFVIHLKNWCFVFCKFVIQNASKMKKCPKQIQSKNISDYPNKKVTFQNLSSIWRLFFNPWKVWMTFEMWKTSMFMFGWFFFCVFFFVRFCWVQNFWDTVKIRKHK